MGVDHSGRNTICTLNINSALTGTYIKRDLHGIEKAGSKA